MAKSSSKIDWYLEQYGASHQNATNKLIHWFCVPAIMFSLFGLLYAIPFPFVESKTFYANWAAVAVVLAWFYYLSLSLSMFFGFVVIGSALVLGNHFLAESLNQDAGLLAFVSLGIFVVAWIGQFIGHKIEGAKPSFLKDVQFLLIGPAWLLHFIYQKVGIRY